MYTVVLRPGREKPVRQRHPWIFSGAIADLRGEPVEGAAVDVVGADGEWLARGTWSGRSQIRVRLFAWNQDDTLDDALLRTRLSTAIAGRAAFATTADAAYRLVFAESDLLPGLIVDRFGDYLVLQLLTQGMAARSELIVTLLRELCAPRGIYERSDAEIREKEGLPPAEGLLWGDDPPARLALVATSTTFLGMGAPPRLYADLRGGQKTGFYLDQAINRALVAQHCAGKEVLDGFCYSGGFAVHAALAGARQIVAADSSAAALELVRDNFALNTLDTPLETVEGDMFRLLRQYRELGRSFDLIVLDPPKFAHSQAQVERAARGYKDINLIAMQLLRPGGILATFSCSGLISPDLFQKIVFGAAVDARRDVQMLARLGHPPDHPILFSFPESEYLKGFTCRVL
jgi:23S rRNA (cytosine1962-C5)-methyltransferase